MCDDDIHPGLIVDPTLSRRSFGLLTAAAAGGWTVKESQVYNAPAAERAWAGLLALYARALA